MIFFWTIGKRVSLKSLSVYFDRSNVKILAMIMLLLQCPTTFAGESEVYACHFQDNNYDNYKIRMKKFFDPSKNEMLGQIDLFENDLSIESTKTKVFQIPLLDRQSYIQIWNSANIRLDAQLDNTQGYRPFLANYYKNGKNTAITCRLLFP